ncbi:alpha/beta fold hydrolase [Pseudomonas sp. M30-35]|uniref:bifunctional alpha/beta hydrolase/OsmC family protein n=1 Tax=Pseudomonas sp. M30-35 TaxID=1981174 RepID=UPI000B3D0842|nr:alpha/beta fold hydrolase [Pseudomonas sp. M30-35]ARU88079.1 osmotically inducible protein C [Pseudomonas sp. M30-35]
MNRVKVEFAGSSGQQLAGLLELPNSLQPVKYYALFAHCFTCGKDIAAASRISRELADQGIAVLRFDFTGLGNSDGDFANTNFTSNVQDLVAAAKMLEARYAAPKLIIGHSLGGAAVLSAVNKIPSLQAVATIAAPSTAYHVQHLFDSSKAEIEAQGEAKVNLGGRKFSIKKQLIEDLDQYADLQHIAHLRCPLIVFHSPLDNIVPVDEASKIFTAAKHPKSFVSLDKADHLLSKKEDARYVAKTLAAWAERYVEVLVAEPVAANLEDGHVLVTELDKKFLRGLYTRSHKSVSDEPVSVGGSDLGPTPYALLLMSLGACTSMTIRMYANRKGIPLEDINIRLVHDRVHAEDCAACEEREGQIERIQRFISFKGEQLTQEQIESMLKIANRCPVHKTLESKPVITTELESGE